MAPEAAGAELLEFAERALAVPGLDLEAVLLSGVCFFDRCGVGLLARSAFLALASRNGAG